MKWSKKKNEIQRPSLGHPWPFHASKSLENSIGKFSAKSQTIPTKPWPLNGANHLLVALTGLEESCCRNQTFQ